MISRVDREVVTVSPHQWLEVVPYREPEKRIVKHVSKRSMLISRLNLRPARRSVNVRLVGACFVSRSFSSREDRASRSSVADELS